ENIGNGTSFGGAAHLRNFVNFLDVSASRFGKEHQKIVGRSSEKMLHEIAFLFLSGALARRHPDYALATTSLRPKRTDRGAFDESAMGDADDAALIPDQIFHRDLTFVRHELSQSGSGVLIANFAQLFLDDGKNALLFCQDVAQVLDRIEQFIVFANDSFAFKSG